MNGKNRRNWVNTKFMLIRFLVYGLLGWVTEIIYTGADSLLKGDIRLAAGTYLWMFPIYGMAVLLEPIHEAIRDKPWLVRGGIWLFLIWAIEYVSGWLLKITTGTCPWDYSGSAYSIHGFIRLDMAVQWFVTGLIFERVHDRLDLVLERLRNG